MIPFYELTGISSLLASTWCSVSVLIHRLLMTQITSYSAVTYVSLDKSHLTVRIHMYHAQFLLHFFMFTKPDDVPFWPETFNLFCNNVLLHNKYILFDGGLHQLIVC